MDRKERFISDWADRLLDELLNTPDVTEGICDGCIWQGVHAHNPANGCDGFHDNCRHSDRVYYVEDLCRQAAETLAEAI